MKFQLMKYLSPLAVIVSLLMLTGCATGPTVRVDFDRLADFTHYQSFGFVSPLGTDRGGYQSIVSQHLKAATQRQLEARGLHLDTVKPQLLINFYAQLNEKLRITTMPEARMGLGRGSVIDGGKLSRQFLVDRMQKAGDRVGGQR